MNMSSMRQPGAIGHLGQNSLPVAALGGPQPNGNLIGPQGQSQSFFPPGLNPAMASFPPASHVPNPLRTAPNPALYAAPAAAMSDDDRRRRMPGPPGQPPHLSPPGPGPHMGSLGAVNPLHPGPNGVFPGGGGMMANPAAVRRANSTGHLNVGVGVGAPPSGINFPGQIGLMGGGGMPIGPQGRGGPQLGQQPPQQQQPGPPPPSQVAGMRAQTANPAGSMPAQMSPGQPMQIPRSGSIPGGIPSGIAPRASSAQQGLMGHHIPPGQQHPGAMQNIGGQVPYGNMIGGGPQHSPRAVQSHSNQHIADVARTRLTTTPENGAMFAGVQGAPPYGSLPGGAVPGPPQGRASAGGGGGAPQFGMGSSPSSQSPNVGPPFQVTPAQQLANMHPGGNGGPGGPIPPGFFNQPEGALHFTPSLRNQAPGQTPRPPSSQTRPGMPPQQPQRQPTPHSQQQQQPQQHSPHPSSAMHPPHQPPPPPPHRMSPHQPGEHMHPMAPSRPQSQPQRAPSRPPSQASQGQQTLPPNAMLFRAPNIGGPSPVPSQTHQPPQPPAHQQHQLHHHQQQPPSMAPPPPHPRTPSNAQQHHQLPPTPTSSGHPMPGQMRIPPPATPSPSDSGAQQMARPLSSMPGGSALGSGQALQRLISFSGMLATEDLEKKCTLGYWEGIMKDYFADNAIMRLHLWKDNENAECKTFEVTTPVIPRFFLVTSQSGVKSMTISFDGAKERASSPSQAEVHCISAVWTYRYFNGYTVTLRGQLVAQLGVTQEMSGSSVQAARAYNQPKIEVIAFTSRQFDKLIAVEAILGASSLTGPPYPDGVGVTPNPPHASVVSPNVSMKGTPRLRNPQAAQNGMSSPIKTEEEKYAVGGVGVGGGGGFGAGSGEETRILFERATIPMEPVNAFGIPQMTMRCLELAESVALMDDLFRYSQSHSDMGPLATLSQYAKELIASGVVPPPVPMLDLGASHPEQHDVHPPYSASPQSSVTMPGGPGGLQPPPPPSQSISQPQPPPVPSNATTPQTQPATAHPSPATAPTSKTAKNTPKLTSSTPNPGAAAAGGGAGGGGGGGGGAPPTPVQTTPVLAHTATKRKATALTSDASPANADAPTTQPPKRSRKRVKNGS